MQALLLAWLYWARCGRLGCACRWPCFWPLWLPFKLAMSAPRGRRSIMKQQLVCYLSRAAGDAALAHFGGAIGVGVALGVVLFVALALPPVRYRLASLPALIIPLLSFGLLLALIYRQGGTGARGMPPGYAALGHMLLYAAQDQKNVGSFRHKICPRLRLHACRKILC